MLLSHSSSLAPVSSQKQQVSGFISETTSLGNNKFQASFEVTVSVLSQALNGEKKKSPDTSPSAEAKDEKAFSEVEASEEPTEAKEEEEVSPAADVIAEEAATGATFTYQQLQAKSEKPVKGIDFKRREAYLSEEEFKTVFGMEKEAFYKLPRWK